MQQGFSWRETRIFDAKCHILHKTVTQLVEPTTTEHDEDDSNYSVSINVALDVETRPSYKNKSSIRVPLPSFHIATK